MSTSAIIDFTDGKKTVRVYIQHDGYPEGQFGILHHLKNFFATRIRTNDLQKIADSFECAEYASYHYTVTVNPKKRGRKRFSVKWK